MTIGFPAEVLELAARVRNWGRWGPDDELGTLNLIDDAARRRGVACVKTGKAISLALPLSPDGPQMGFVAGRINPQLHPFSFPLTDEPDEDRFWHDDRLDMGTQACTHWDGLAHASYGGTIYNGFPDSEIGEHGAPRCGIHNVRSLVSRGVLLDVARVHGVDQLVAGYALTAEDLDAAVELARVTLEPGDVILLRTGHIRTFLRGERLQYAIGAPGPSLATVEWFHRNDVAAVAIDNLIFEVFPCERDDAYLPVHFLHLVDMGLTQGQNWDMEALAADCADDGRYAFLISASPEPVLFGAGAPVNPVVVK
jgi:kynurenine formamidase